MEFLAAVGRQRRPSVHVPTGGFEVNVEAADQRSRHVGKQAQIGNLIAVEDRAAQVVSVGRFCQRACRRIRERRRSVAHFPWLEETADVAVRLAEEVVGDLLRAQGHGAEQGQPHDLVGRHVGTAQRRSPPPMMAHVASDLGSPWNGHVFVSLHPKVP